MEMAAEKESRRDKPLVWMASIGIENPPFSAEAKQEAGYLLREVQRGSRLGMPASDTMPEIGKDCHELRIVDKNVTHRIFYAIRMQAIVVLDILPGKKTRATPRSVIEHTKKRLAEYELRSGDKR